jgi:hypothetical protein
MNSYKNILIALSLIVCGIVQAMEKKHTFINSSLLQAAEEASVDESEKMVVEKTHTPVKMITKYRCEQGNCKFFTSHESRIQSHVAMHRIQDTKPQIKIFHCKICDYITDLQKNMDTHMHRHDEQKQYHCDICDTYFSTFKSKQRHERESTKHKNRLIAYSIDVLS